MPFQITLERDLLHLVYTGYVTKAEIFESARQISAMDATFTHRPHQLVDLSGIEERETTSETLASVAEERHQRVFPNGFKLAIFAPTTLAFGLARLFQTMAGHHPQMEIQVFRTREEAESWLAKKS